MALLPPEALIEISRVLSYGAQKYAPHNWRSGMNWSRLVSSTLRHIMAWQGGEDKDPETGISHLAHAACGLMFLVTYEVRQLGEDDRYE